jgi:flavorubredoxin
MAPAHEPVKLTQKLGDWTNKKKRKSVDLFNQRKWNFTEFP